nr:MAG TPA: hypothetical protein [Caudoviricetes sp.]
MTFSCQVSFEIELATIGVCNALTVCCVVRIS